MRKEIQFEKRREFNKN